VNRKTLLNLIFGVAVLFCIVSLLVSCTPAQQDWRNNLYADVSVGGDQYKESTVVSTGLSYPLVWNVWGTMGMWSDFYGAYGPYWGLSYAWAPFAGGNNPFSSPGK